ncbi:methanogenesis marker protein 8 [Methanolacinia petrolearia DSM 11571]|uniref:Methanogenesis marker protein 8 n=1 Tax=Methanolacinia petrolearia (strain DSM 11571 / OCM 486 / SEBR 4847) TaxID=679926 RepID=E1RD37_METP4|nr:methanogenesis marker 8 protein [Methanolacinia petrolearia]ADN35937.1 methanogenesis marker protein 8 [Methanolacinia petrolearia DSM 11571]
MTEIFDEHIIEASGRCRIIVRNGEVVEVGEAMIKSCPLTKKFSCPVYDLDRESVKANIEYRIKTWGMCTPERKVIENREFVGFGASEILSFGLSAGMLDAVVLACDGAGTLVSPNPSLVQGIGGRMSGLVKTVPYENVIRRIEEAGGLVIDKENASLDQMAGLAKAYELGYEKVAVTVALPAEAEKIRQQYPDAIIFGVHVTGLGREEAETLVSVSDFVTSCASATIREAAGKKVLVQAGTAIPTYAMTRIAKDIILEKVRCGDEQVLVKTTKLPVASGSQPEPLV